MTKNEQAMMAAVIYAVISVILSTLGGLFTWAVITAPLHLLPIPFLGAMLFLSLAGLSGWASVHCAKLS